MDNNDSLLDKIKSKIILLIGDETFDADDGSGARAPDIYKWSVPPKRDNVAPNVFGDFPQILLRPTSGGAVGIIGTTEVIIRVGIWSPGDYQDGAAETDRMLSLLTPLQQPADYSPWSQDDEYGLQWQIGDKEEASNPHPYHYVFLKMRFQFDTGFNNHY